MDGVNISSITGVPEFDSLYRNFSFNPVFMTIVIVVLVGYLLLFTSLGGNSNVQQDAPAEEGKLLGVFIASAVIILLLINGFNYFFNMDIVTSVSNIFTAQPEIDFDINTKVEGRSEGNEPQPNLEPREASEQVYHVPNNLYTYTDAKAVCKAFGGRLANIKEMQKAWEKGAEWCSYGWSDDQMALFPTQHKTWRELQKIKGHENDCGRPGINGGYIDNKHVRFGANCYGVRPKQTPLEAELMELTPQRPITKSEMELAKRVNHFKSELPNLIVSPWNRNEWSEKA